LLLGTGKNGRTAWQHTATRCNSEILESVWEWTKENQTTDEINYKILLGTDYDGRTAWNFAVAGENSELLRKVW